MFGIIGVIAGNIFIFTLIIGAVIVCIELLWYRAGGKGGKSGGKRIAIITGASSGLGRMYAALAEEKYKDIDEIWLVARRLDKLKETSELLSCDTRCLSVDLTDEEDMENLGKCIRERNATIGLLINCAGFGKIGDHSTIDIKQQTGMIALNCTAAVALTDMCLPFMSRGSRIINVCSAAGFQPLQKLSVYAASKSFLLKYSRALRMELLPKRISVTAVCPYWIKDTEFIPVAKTKDKGVRHFPLSSDVVTVGKLSFLGAKIGLPVVTPGIVCTIHRFFSKLIPDTVLQYIWEVVRRV